MNYIQSTVYPGKGGIEINKALEAVDRLKRNNMSLFILAPAVKKFSEELIELYQDFLSLEMRVEAKKNAWGNGKTIAEYRDFFLYSVLMRAYRPFDETHKNYYGILELIRRYNPEWEKAYVARHDRWVKMLMARKVPIYIGTQ